MTCFPSGFKEFIFTIPSIVLTYKKLFTELYEKVDYNCEKLDLDFKINLSDPNTRISWNFNVYAKLLTFDFNYTRRDGLVACHAGALFGFFFIKIN